MEDRLTTLFSDYDGGRVSRRQLLQLLGIAALAKPVSAFAQGSCGGTRAGTPQCDTVRLKSPFEPTGWKTVLMDHFSLQCADYQREVAYYSALMGWKLRSDDGVQAVMDVGDWGGVIIRGGLAAGGRRAVWDNMCWGIEPWDTNKVEAALKARGLSPVADHKGDDFRSFHVKDPDGFDLQISNGNRSNRRTSPATAKPQAPLPFEPTGWKTVWLDHISFEVTSYKESVAFYEALLGWKGTGDEGSQNETEIAPNIGGLIIRGGNANAPGGLTSGRAGRGAGRAGSGTDSAGRNAAPATPPPLVRRAQMGHISFGIQDFDPDKVLAELQKRSLSARADTGATGDIHVAAYKSYHTTTPNGYDLQISNTVSR